MPEKYAIHVQGLDKDYGDVHAVKSVDFTIDQGEIFSLLGPNGAGKTTTIAMLSCLLEPTAGDARVMGHSITKAPMRVKETLGVVPQEIALYEDLSARGNLIFWGKMYNLRGEALEQRVAEVLELTGLTERQKGHVKAFSGGMKRRLNIGVALLHKPQIIYMDEPTVGIDPQSRRRILDGVKALNAEGMTVLYTTHYMEEAQELSDHVAIMDHGEIIAYGTHEELIDIVGELDRVTLTIDATESKDVLERWRATDGVDSVSAEDGTIHLLVDDSNLVLPRLFGAANDAGVRITSVDIMEPNLETVFLHLTGRALRD
jgi:ABC-2 type transport system ATP-binding protein